MADFERFLKDNNLKKIDIADYLQVSKAFITQLCNGSRRLPPEKFALLQAKGWDTTALLESDQPYDNSNSGNVTRIGNISGVRLQSFGNVPESLSQLVIFVLKDKKNADDIRTRSSALKSIVYQISSPDSRRTSV